MDGKRQRSFSGQPEEKDVLAAEPGRLRQWIEYLALEIGRRPQQRPDLLRKVADRLAGTFTGQGFAVHLQEVAGFSSPLYNVIACRPGRDPLDSGGRLLVVGAHYDTVSQSPGADDNASGVAGLMELARLLAADIPSSLLLVAFCPEEPPAFRTRRMGSLVHARSLKRRRVRLTGMVCLEMIGYFVDTPGSQLFPMAFMNRIYPDRGNFIALVGNLHAIAWTGRVRHAFAAGTGLPVERLNGPAFLVPGIDFSDHWAYSRCGYPALMVTDTAFYRNPHYHRYSDLPSTIDYRRCAMVVDGLVSVVRKLA